MGSGGRLRNANPHPNADVKTLTLSLSLSPPPPTLPACAHNRASHDVLTRALGALGCMEHRGACAADGVSGDGAGVLAEAPWALL